MKTQTCFVANEGYRTGEIRLTQQGRDKFTVRYGLQVRSGLTYNQAATELGAVLMHDAACAGKLDNREKGER